MQWNWRTIVRAGCVTLGSCVASACALGPGDIDVRLYALDCGRMVTNGIHAANPCFLIRHPRGDLLWDLGLPPAMADARDGVTMGRVHIKVERKLVDLLADLKLEPADIDYVSFSHSHFDHVGNAGAFTDAIWIVSATERAWALRPDARATIPALKAALERPSTMAIDTEHDMFGDGTVTLMQAPGHTAGHMVLLLRLPETGYVLLAGDTWNTQESWIQPTGSAQELATIARLKDIAATKGARVVRQHVAADFEALPRFPAPLR